MTADDIVGDLRRAWSDHWRYVQLSAILFAIGGIIGVVIAALGIDLFAALGFDDFFEEALPEELTTATILINNSIVFLLAVIGVLTFGLLTAIILVFNGLVVGYVVVPAAQDAGVGFVIAAILPHGILELPAFFVASAVALRLIHRFVQRIRGDRETVLSPGDPKRLVLLLGVAWIVLAIAAVIEVHVTVWLIETLFPEEAGNGL